MNGRERRAISKGLDVTTFFFKYQRDVGLWKRILSRRVKICSIFGTSFTLIFKFHCYSVDQL